ncbi:hypothetical protein V501_03957 [Pseudogymnoascus sp. VKM F-4519 (FW-2642)]|nr:hypothetical protein V501_03957 [Pseudogymnoascus sp. VKM F-4519 (FW-2642)]
MGIPPQIPKEVLREIVSYLNRSDDLTPCPLSGVALSALYGHVDLRTFPFLDSAYVYDMEDSDADADVDADDDDDEEVLQDKNPNLGQLASAFSDGTELHYFSDAPDSLTPDTIISAASSMTSLTSAKLTKNVLSACIISSLHSYPHLERLYVQDLSPFEVIWDSTKLTSLRSLKWRIPNVHRWPNGDEELRGIIRGIIGYIANVVRRTCPLLTELDIIIEDSFSDVNGSYKLPDIPQQAVEGVEDRVRFYQDTAPDDDDDDDDESLTLGNLQHLGLQWNHYNVVDSQTWQLVERLIRQNSSTLTSLTIPSDLCDPILNSSITLKNLTSLSIDGTVRTPVIAEGITSRFGTQLERFSLSDTDTPFTASLGQTFGSWTRLKYLCIGDVEMAGGPYGNDGRPDFEAYDLMEFITHLPRGLEELYLRIHGYSLWLDDPSDFEPMRRLAGPIFRRLRCLHTCDILAYISNMDGGLSMEQPENAVHYRRLPHLRVGCGDADGGVSDAREEGLNKERRRLDTTSRTKDIWTSTMDSVYQDENNPVISHSCQTIEVDEDGDGDAGFEGRDAEGVWMVGETVFCGGDKTWPGQTGFRLWRYEEYERAGSGKGV